LWGLQVIAAPADSALQSGRPSPMIAAMPANTEKASAGRHLLVYAILVALVAGYTVLVWNERSNLEGYRDPTGLADAEMYDLKANPLDPRKPMAKLDGVGYFAADKSGRPLDRYMVKVARDDDDRYYFYQFSSVIGGGGVEQGSSLYLKTDPDRYIKVSPTGKNPPPPDTE
jgi:hypothetical protein